MIICTRSFRPSIVGLVLSHLVSAASIFSMIGDQGVVSGASFPSQAPRIHMDSPSSAIWILSGIHSCSSLAQRSCSNFSLKILLPIGIICVLDVLNCAPAARCHWLRISVRSDKELSFPRNVVVSSAKRFVISLSWVPGIVSPLRLDFHIAKLSGSIPRLKRRQDRGSPWWTPLITWNSELRIPFIITLVDAFEYRF